MWHHYSPILHPYFWDSVKYLLPFYLLLFSPNGVSGQIAAGLPHTDSYHRSFQDTVWTVRGATPLDDRYRKWKGDFVLDARQTLVSSTPARLAGVRLGAEYRRVHRFGIGVYTLGDGVKVQTLSEVSPNIEDAVINLSYASLFYERVMYFGKKWEWSLTGHAGRGRLTARYTFAGEDLRLEHLRRVNLVEGSTTLYYHLTWFISIGAGVGYRYIPDTPAEIRHVYNAPVSILRVRVRLIKMVSGLFNKDIRTAY